MKFLHTADLHLGAKSDNYSDALSDKIAEGVFASFEYAIEYARREGIGAIIIAGDVFDSASPNASVVQRFMHDIISNGDLVFFCVGGNHDGEDFPYTEKIPENLLLFNNKWTYYSYDGVTVCGCRTERGKGLDYDRLKLDRGQFNVIVLHGQIADFTANAESDLICLPRLKNKNINYLALGHIHSFATGEIDSRARFCYPGCVGGRGFDEIGEKGFVIVDTEATENPIKFVASPKGVLFTEERITLDKDRSFYQTVDEKIKEYSLKYNRPAVAKIITDGEYAEGKRADLPYLREKALGVFEYVKISDKSRLFVDEKAYASDKSVKGEFVRKVINSDLSPETKREVLACGINAFTESKNR